MRLRMADCDLEALPFNVLTKMQKTSPRQSRPTMADNRQELRRGRSCRQRDGLILGRTDQLVRQVTPSSGHREISIP